jgi:hypothetical protein
MALEAKLKIEKKVYNIWDLDYRLCQPTDHNGKPTSITNGGLINFTVLATTGPEEFFFHDWVLSLSEVKDGEFELPITEGIEHTKTVIEFEKAYCTDLQIFYSNTNDKQVFMKITISATKLYFTDGVEYVNKNLETKG